MEIKKSPKADLQNKRGLLLEIGLIIALGGVIAAFAWTPKEQKIEKLDLNIAPVEEEIMEITRQEQKPPEPPKKTEITVITDILKVVTNDTKITTNVDFAEFEDDVEIGAGTCIDRATIADTVVQRGTKMDNQVQIGHNCRVGKNCIIASQSGVAGSTTIEDGVIMGARSGLNGHIKVARGTQIAGMGIVMKNTKPGQILSGHPATDHMEDFRFKASLRRVPDMMKRLKKLEEVLAHESIHAEKGN